MSPEKLVCGAQTNWCFFSSLAIMCWTSSTADVPLWIGLKHAIQWCVQIVTGIQNVMCFFSFAALTGKSEPHVMSNGTGSILWSILPHHCCGTSGNTLPFNMQSVLCCLFTLLNSTATAVWPGLWGMQFRTVPQPEEAPPWGLGLCYVILCN